MNIQTKPNDLAAFWMPFSANWQFKKAPRLFVEAKGVHYVAPFCYACGNDGTRCVGCKGTGAAPAEPTPPQAPTQREALAGWLDAAALAPWRDVLDS